MSELIEVIIERSLLNVHDVIFDLTEFIDSYLEFSEDLFKTVSKSSTFGVSDLNLIKSLELLDGACEMHDVLASL